MEESNYLEVITEAQTRADLQILLERVSEQFCSSVIT